MAESNDSKAAPAAPVVKPNVAGLQPRPLRVLVASSLGTVGKSTISENVVLPGLGCKRLYAVESPNVENTKYGVPVELFGADELPEMRRAIMTDKDPVIVDLGASDFGNFVEALYDANLFPMFDYCVLVGDPTDRGQEAVVGTHKTFSGFGMPAEKFRLVLNRVAMSVRDQKAAVLSQFHFLFQFAEKNPAFWINPECLVPELATLFTELKDAGRSLGEVLADQTDYEDLAYTLSCAGDAAGADNAARRGVVAQYAIGANAYFERAYKLLDLRPKKTANAGS
jgi:MinD-like ATPase involved in chromosome partitioning or flagellar assembly